MHKPAIPLSAAAVLLGMSSVSLAGHGRDDVDYARVTHVEPIVRHVTVTTPRRECWEEPVTHYETRNDYTTGRTILGGLIGAAIGNQIGRGRGNDAATVVGGLAGAAIGANSAKRDRYTEEYVSYEEHCRTVHERHTEERIDGYEVTYRYGGRTYTTITDEHPGKHIPVDVRVRPAYRY